MWEDHCDSLFCDDDWPNLELSQKETTKFLKKLQKKGKMWSYEDFKNNENTPVEWQNSLLDVYYIIDSLIFVDEE